MSRHGIKRNTDDESDIDLTPMLDVVFIMLIFFIVTASFVKESGIEINRPDSSDAPPNDESVSIVVMVSDTNEIHMENRRIDIRAVRANVQRLHAENPEAPVIINAEEKARAATLISVADSAREAGVFAVSLVTQ